MHEWLDWARGPAFRFAFAFMILGILRLVILNLVSLRGVLKNAGDKNLSTRRIAIEAVKWAMPVGKVPGRKAPLVISSIAFHLAILLVAIFLSAHLLLWKRAVGFHLPPLGNHIADVLTLVGIVGGLVLLFDRIFGQTARALSRGQDYLILALVLVTLGSGFLAMHPEINPFLYNTTMFVHVMSGNLIFISLPFSKLSHAVLFPFNQLAAELGWHLAPSAGRAVATALGKEKEPV